MEEPAIKEDFENLRSGTDLPQPANELRKNQKLTEIALGTKVYELVEELAWYFPEEKNAKFLK